MLVIEDGPEEQSWYSFRQWARQQRVVAFDTETSGLRPFHGDRLVGISIGVGERTWYLPFRHEQGPNLSADRLAETVDYLQTREQLIGHHTKFDMHMLAREGYQIPSDMPYTKDCEVLDTMLGAHLVNENEKIFGVKGSGYALKYLCDKYRIGQGSKDEEELREVVVTRFRKDIAAARKAGVELKGSTDGMWKGFMWKLPPEQVSPYAEADVFLTWALFEEYVWPHLRGLGLLPLFHQICNYNLLITAMEELGVKVDEDALVRETEIAMDKAKRAEDDLWLATGIDNCMSNPQVRRVFPQVESTREKILKFAVMEGRADAEHAELLLDARGKRKVVESYFVPYFRYLAKDGAIHPGFKVHGTATGRLACSDPNIMALPRDVTNQRAKAVFVARPGYVLAEIDLSQAELRVASHFAAELAGNHSSPPTYLDPVNPEYTRMGAVLADPDSDLHTETMIRMQQYNPSIDRDLAKRVNLSAIFGIGAHKFSREYAVPFVKAKEALNIWRDIYPEFVLLYEAMDAIATTHGYIQLPISGRFRRYTNEGDNYTSKASSNEVQGTVADIMRIAMHNTAEYLRTVEGFLLLQVHDSLLVEIPHEGNVPEIIQNVQAIMTDFEIMPALRTEAKIGHCWADMKAKETRHDVAVTA